MQKRRILCLMLCLILVFTQGVSITAQDQNDPQIKNIIYMIPDGGGMAPFFLADKIKQNGGFSKEVYPNLTEVETGDMYIKQYLVGAETTYSASHAVTDSAAGGTALAGGYKTNNGMIGISNDFKPHATILEACQMIGKSTGLVATHSWPDATPAAFSSHTQERTEYSNIGEQMVNQKIDLIIACASEGYNSKEWYSDEGLEKRGYKVVKTKEDLNNIVPGEKIVGKIPDLYYEINRPSEIPTLAELTKASLYALSDQNENGFFLMVEGSAIDNGGHNSSTIEAASEFLAFDKACEVAIEYAKKRNDTLVVILPDHDTGGLKIVKDDYSAQSLDAIVESVQNGIEPEDLPWEGWITSDTSKKRSHTKRDGGIFMYVPDGVNYPEGIDITKKADVLNEFEQDFTTCETNRINNTHIAPYLASLVDVDLEECTDKLFVDVTDFGTYNSSTKEFTITSLNGTKATIKKNASSALIGDKEVDLDGQIAVYINERFYVPKLLFDKLPLRKETGLKILADYNTKTVTIEGVSEKELSNIAIMVTEPKTSISESVGSDGFATFPYINQIKSTPWREYKVSFKVKEGKIGDYTYYTRINNAQNIENYKFSFKDMTVVKDDVVIEKISDLSENDNIKLVLSGYDSSYDGIAAIVQYGENNKIINITSQNIKGSAVEYTDNSTLDATVLKDVKKIKTFYWSKSSIAPFIGTYIIE